MAKVKFKFDLYDKVIDAHTGSMGVVIALGDSQTLVRSDKLSNDGGIVQLWIDNYFLKSATDEVATKAPAKKTRSKKAKPEPEEIEDDLEDDEIDLDDEEEIEEDSLEDDEIEDDEIEEDDELDSEEVDDDELEDEEEPAPRRTSKKTSKASAGKPMPKAEFTKRVAKFVRTYKVKGKVNPKAAQKKVVAALKKVKAPRVANVKQANYSAFLALLK